MLEIAVINFEINQLQRKLPDLHGKARELVLGKIKKLEKHKESLVVLKDIERSFAS